MQSDAIQFATEAFPLLSITQMEPKLYDARRRPLVRRAVIERRYGVSPRTLGNWMKSGKIPYFKIGSLLFFEISQVDQALKRFQVNPIR